MWVRSLVGELRSNMPRRKYEGTTTPEAHVVSRESMHCKKRSCMMQRDSKQPNKHINIKKKSQASQLNDVKSPTWVSSV